ncbi:MAG: homoserine O-succinyltransferase [Lachnospiraceae bacterium]|nr:homoserine O-succinyltransferase [Lachnospiraceae bacterium]
MPIRVQGDLPAREILERENIFVMDEGRAEHQDIRPLEIAILNLMPLKEDTELQLLRSLSNTPIQVNVTFVHVSSHEAKNTSTSHLNKFYVYFEDIKKKTFDGMIITGAPVEQLEYEEVDYWDELCEILDWTKGHVTSTMHLCWGAQAALYHHFGLKKRMLDHKMFGLFWHKVLNRKIPLVRGFDDMFLAPHSRHTDVSREDIAACEELMILAESEEAGVFLTMTKDGKQIFMMGHPEYDRISLDTEYHRDLNKGLPIDIPKNYYRDNNPENKPLLMWRSHANNLYTNWINYYVYQITPYSLNEERDK